jgi:hypothetical protein
VELRFQSDVHKARALYRLILKCATSFHKSRAECPEASDWQAEGSAEAVAREVEESAYRTGVARRERTHVDMVM